MKSPQQPSLRKPRMRKYVHVKQSYSGGSCTCSQLSTPSVLVNNYKKAMTHDTHESMRGLNEDETKNADGFLLALNRNN